MFLRRNTDVGANRIVSKSTENSNCSCENSEKSETLKKRTFKRKRDREPSRIPVRIVLKSLTKKRYRKRVKYLLSTTHIIIWPS